MKSLLTSVIPTMIRNYWLIIFLLITTVLVVPDVIHGADWTREIAAEGHWFQNLQPDSMILDSGETLHMVYGHGRLYYRTETSSGVSTEVVDASPGTGSNAVLALDNNGEPMIAYRDLGLNQLKFAWREAGSWHFSQLDSGENIGTYMSIRADSNGLPHIVYSDMFHNDLIYAFKNTSGVWRKEIIDDSLPGEYCDLVLYNNEPRVAYFSASDNNLMIASRASYNTWDRYMLNTTDTDGRCCSVTVGTADNIMAVFYNSTDQAINMVRCDNGTFTSVYEVDSVQTTFHLDVTSSYDGQLKVAYIDSIAKDCRVAHGIYSNWDIETVHSSGSALRSPAIEMLPSGLTVVRYINSDTAWMYLGRTYGSSGWTTESIARSYSNGFNTRMVTDSQGYPYSIFNDYPTFYTHSVRHDGFEWRKDPYPLVENIPGDYDLTIFPDGKILAVSGKASQLIRGHYYDGNTWHDEDIFACSGTPIFLNLAIDSNDNVFISCKDNGSGNVILLESSTWNGPFILTELGACSGDCDIAIDSQNQPHIIFESADDNSLSHVWRTDSSTWNTETLAPFSGDFVEMVLDSQDRLYATIYGIFLSDPYIVRPNGQDYIVEPIPDPSLVMPGIKLALTDTETISLAYLVTNFSYLRYAEFDGTDWHFESPLDNETVSMLSFVQSPITGITIGCHSNLSGDYLMITKRTGIDYRLNLNDDMFTPGEPFILTHQIANNTDAAINVDEYLILDVMGRFWFWPSWSEALDLNTQTISAGNSISEEAFNFVWPTGTGTFSPIYFWGGICHAGTADLIQYDFAQWGYGE